MQALQNVSDNMATEVFRAARCSLMQLLAANLPPTLVQCALAAHTSSHNGRRELTLCSAKHTVPAAAAAAMMHFAAAAHTLPPLHTFRAVDTRAGPSAAAAVVAALPQSAEGLRALDMPGANLGPSGMAILAQVRRAFSCQLFFLTTCMPCQNYSLAKYSIIPCWPLFGGSGHGSTVAVCGAVACTCSVLHQSRAQWRGDPLTGAESYCFSTHSFKSMHDMTKLSLVACGGATSSVLPGVRFGPSSMAILAQVLP
jgi:hypothetical protein